MRNRIHMRWYKKRITGIKRIVLGSGSPFLSAVELSHGIRKRRLIDLS